MTLLADVVAASTEVAETSSRSRKIAALAELLRGLDPDEVAIAAGLLAGAPRQGRIGVGYSTIYGVAASPAATASLTLRELDAAIDELQQSTGEGSTARRRRLLEELLGRATADESRF